MPGSNLKKSCAHDLSFPYHDGGGHCCAKSVVRCCVGRALNYRRVTSKSLTVSAAPAAGSPTIACPPHRGIDRRVQRAVAYDQAESF